MNVIPAIDLMGGQVVRLYKGDPKQKVVYSDDPIQVAKEWESDGADMLHIVDLDATLGLGSNTGMIKNILDSVSIPVQVAGGLRTVTSALKAAKTADRIVVGTLAFYDEKSLFELYTSLGSKRLVVSADHKDGEIVVRGWQDGAGIQLADAVSHLIHLGISEILVTSVSHDGTLQGPDIENLKLVCNTKANIIASGGISGLQDISNVKKIGSWGVILGKALYDGKISIREAKQIAHSSDDISEKIRTGYTKE